jgi:hypothetical protein
LTASVTPSPERRKPSRPNPPPAPPRISPVPFAAMIGLTCVLFLDVASVVVVHWWVVALLVVAWLLVFLLACAWWTPYPRRLPWLAAFGLVLWVLVVIGGSIAFG